MTKADITKALESIATRADAEVQKLADRFREERLLPFCRRHQLTYVAGMGRFVWYRNGKPVYAEELGYLRVMNAILDEEVLGNSNSVFGFFISEITEQDIAP